jgi:hypothetical protein
MKKKFLAMVAGICLAVAVTSFTGCGSKEGEPSSGSVSKENEEKNPTPTTGKLLSSDKLFSNVDEYIEAQKDQIDEMLKSYEDSGMTMEISSEGETLLYRYIYDDPMEVTQAVLDYFDSSISDYRKQFDSVIAEMERVIDIENPAVELRYENPDGTLIYSCLLTKDGEKPTYGEITTDSESEKFASMQEYVDSQKEIFDETLKQLEGSGMSMKIYAEGNTLVYHYIYDNPVEVSEEDLAEMETTLTGSKEQFQTLIRQLETLIDADDIAIKILYENPDGSEVYSTTITK